MTTRALTIGNPGTGTPPYAGGLVVTGAGAHYPNYLSPGPALPGNSSGSVIVGATPAR